MEALVDSSSEAAAVLAAVGWVDWALAEVPSDCTDQTVEDTNRRVPLHVEASNLCHLHSVPSLDSVVDKEHLELVLRMEVLFLDLNEDQLAADEEEDRKPCPVDASYDQMAGHHSSVAPGTDSVEDAASSEEDLNDCLACCPRRGQLQRHFHLCADDLAIGDEVAVVDRSAVVKVARDEVVDGHKEKMNEEVLEDHKVIHCKHCRPDVQEEEEVAFAAEDAEMEEGRHSRVMEMDVEVEWLMN